jgi:hypothetical protein
MRPSALVAPCIVMLGACHASPWPAAAVPVACLRPQGAVVTDATISFHPPIVEGDEPTVVLARARGLIGSTTITAAERERPATVHMRVAAPIRGRVRTPPGHVGPVRVSVIRMQTVYVPRDRDGFAEQGLARTWSPAAKAWLPRIDELDAAVAPDGTFVIEATREAALLAFTGPGLAEARRWTSPSGAAIDVEMQPEAVIAVVVTDPAAEPVAGVDVGVATVGAGEQIVWRRRTGADGGAAFDGLPAGDYVVSVLVPEMAGHVRRTRVHAGRTANVPVQLDRGVLLHGHVRDPDGNGVPGVRLLASTTAEPDAVVGAARTGADGAFRLRLPREPVSIELVEVPAGCTVDTAACAVDVASVRTAETTRDFVLARR